MRGIQHPALGIGDFLLLIETFLEAAGALAGPADGGDGRDGSDDGADPETEPPHPGKREKPSNQMMSREVV